MKNDTARSRWYELDRMRSNIISRSEKYAAFTIPKICPPEGYDENNTELTHDWQALGAMATNNLVTKLMMTLFSPTRPFFRLEVDDKVKERFESLGVTNEQLAEVLSIGERNAVKELDRKSLRPKLFEVLKHLIIVGNVLFVLDDKIPRVIGIKNYVVKRSVDGDLLELIVKDCVTYQQLDDETRKLYAPKGSSQDDDKLNMYRWFRKEDGEYKMETWLEDKKLPDEYSGKWGEENFPYLALTWNLGDNDDYGTGHVQDYEGDFEALSMLSKAQVQGGVLASEYRWLVNPNGQTRPEDMQDSENGDVIPGEANDINLVHAQVNDNISTIMAIKQEYVKRISSAFLLGMGVTRDAERVTAAEIRMQAQELENGLGGAYSRIAVSLQIPFSYFLLRSVSPKIKGKDIKPVVIGGLDSLSRSYDADNLKMWLSDVAALGNLPPYFKQAPIAKKLASEYGIRVSDYMVSEQEAEQIRAREQAIALQQVNKNEPNQPAQ